MKNLTPRNIASACGGSCHHMKDIMDREVTSVVIDSRKAEAGCLFIPIKGDNNDGHDFISNVMEKGARLTLTERAEAAGEYPYILVKSTNDALLKIAGFYRRQLAIPVVGITGSVGKTSTKEVIASVLSVKYKTLKTDGNFNNNIGLPLTIFRLKDDDEIAVLEMGISHFGEMTELAGTAAPDTMVITNIGTCHLEFLKDRDGVFRAKTECFDYVALDGTVVLNGDDDKLRQVKDVHGRAPVFYGMDPSLRVYAENVKSLGFDGSSCTINIDDRAFDVTIPIPGEHMVMNALAGAAVGSLYGLEDEEIRQGIENLKALPGRFNIIKGQHFRIIDDCYNANPMSMKASLGILGGEKGRRVAILGDMGELGADEAALHREVGDYAGTLGLDEYIIVGKLSQNIAEGIKASGNEDRIRSFASVEALLPELPGLLKEGDTVLVKASHFMHFEEIVKTLT